ncbi:MAG: META domain-containing protein [Candidatus Brachytrichaceae bacterium NZ_4S206]
MGAASALMLAACAVPPPPPRQAAQPAPAAPAAPTTNPLAGTSWTLTTLGGQPTLQGATATLNFGADGRASGTDGCNAFSGGYEVSGDALTFGPLLGTLMACEASVMAQADAFRNALEQTARFTVANDALTLQDANGAALATFAPQRRDLAGTNWVVTGYNNGKQAVVGVLQDTELTVSFGADGRVSGSAGCNNFTGSFTQTGDAIEISPLASTAKMCPDPAGIMEQEAQFLQAMQSAKVIQLDGDRLTLRTADGAMAVTLRRAPEPNALAGTSWTLATLGGQPPVADTAVTLNFEADGRAGGSDGCNTFGGPYQVSGDALKFGALIGTLVACEAPIMAQADAFRSALEQTARFTVANDTLTLLDTNGNALATFAPQSRELAGTNWVVTGYNNGKQAVVSVLQGTELSVSFGADGRVAGNAGCNNFFGPFTQQGETVAIGPLASTLKACAEPAGVMEQEVQFLAALESATAYQLDGDKLTLRTGDGATAVTLSRAP